MTVASPREILVLVECDASGEPTATSLAAVTFARRLCQIQETTLALCLLQGPNELDKSGLLRLGAAVVLRCQSDTETPLLAEHVAPTLSRLVVERNAFALLSAATSTGKDLLPRVAALLDCAFISDCCEASTEGSTLSFRRPVYAGNATAICVVHSGRVILTIRHSEFSPAVADESTQSPIVPFALTPPTGAANRVRRLGFEAVASDRPLLTEARVVVSGGRALGSRFAEVLGPLADSLGAALGATRAACDAGYAPSDFQVGQTGKVVAPDLYLAIGISGAVQHIAGMRSSRVVVAINSDPQAYIFSIADYGLVGDLFEIVPKLVSTVQQRKRSAGT